ncbi:hypothetical protein GUITHDRAFT_155085 [Guillardia theta CCMP2712]|uniref:Uncharacterized protein n=1 Tax=Guillardia theta (strain CCMP2712) TaxID=905079 RepID=L1ILI3_GUITC|nr:hypothetical protein GUITHDRAFT_155085 [Guillardia theta CCMP2712]EKX36982.1 hypothetical protein GUITHDRAFT_155085 [Guillardia theta CCMP2712]|eukprot:XP_005823962.1 hypothetical protein GUITHDRAFT_155085 [Guillardia theta CCMP2712]
MSAYFMAKITQSMCESEPSCKANLRRAKGFEVSIGWFLKNADGWIETASLCKDSFAALSCTHSLDSWDQ